LFNYAISKGVISQDAYPFGQGDDKVQIRAVRKTKKALTKKEFLTLMAYRPKLLKSQVRNFDLCVLSFLLNGANMIDIALLTYGRNYSIEDKKITFYREKTYKSKNEMVPVEVKVTKDIEYLIGLYGNECKPENYIFKILNPNLRTSERVQVNSVVRAIDKTLKRVAKKCGVRDDLSYGFFRHTHATLALKEAGANLYDLMTSMGHSSIKTTQAYISSLPDEDNVISDMKTNLMVGVFDKQ
jgi:integrase